MSAGDGMREGGRLADFVACATDWFWELDEQGRISYVTPGVDALLGVSPGHLLGRPLEDLIDSAPDTDEAAFRAALADGQPFHDLVWRMVLPSAVAVGATRYVRSSGRPFHGVGGRFAGMRGACADITADREAVMALTEERRQADDANQAKSRFVATMSHELRTPMTAILGAVSLLSEDMLSESQASLLETIRQSGTVMMSTLNDILDLAKVEGGKLELMPEPTDLSFLAHSVVAMMEPQATRKGLTLMLQVDEGLPGAVQVDQASLRRVMINLVGNAVKFTTEGKVSLGLRSEPGAQSGRSRVRLEVTDTGIGIPAHLHDAVFDPFAQGDPQVARRHGGSGLGLTICRRLVGAMGGRIGLISAPTRGSTFWVDLDLPTAPGVAVPAVGGEGLGAGAAGLSVSSAAWAGGFPRPRPRPLHVLLAEDVALNRMVITKLLERDGHTVHSVGDGASAVAAVAMGLFDLVLMDVRMPGMDGIEATLRIRDLADAGRADLPIVALTANVMPEDRGRFAAAGMNGVVGKPLNMDTLYETLATVLPAEMMLGGEGASPPVVLRPAGRRRDGEDLAALRGRSMASSAPPPPSWPPIPTAAASARALQPVSPLPSTARPPGQGGGARPPGKSSADRPTAAPVSAPASAGLEQEESTQPLVDEGLIASFLQLFGRAGVDDLKRVFEDQGTAQVHQMVECSGRGDLKEVASAAHKLISASGSIGLRRLQSLATEVEAAALKRDADRLAILLGGVDGVLARSLSALDALLPEE